MLQASHKATENLASLAATALVNWFYQQGYRIANTRMYHPGEFPTLQHVNTITPTQMNTSTRAQPGRQAFVKV